MFCRVALWGLLCCWTPILAVAADDSSPVQVDLTPFAGSVEPIVMEPQSVPGAREPQPLPTVPVLKAHQRGRIFEFWWQRAGATATQGAWIGQAKINDLLAWAVAVRYHPTMCTGAHIDRGDASVCEGDRPGDRRSHATRLPLGHTDDLYGAGTAIHRLGGGPRQAGQPDRAGAAFWLA